MSGGESVEEFLISLGGVISQALREVDQLAENDSLQWHAARQAIFTRAAADTADSYEAKLLRDLADWEADVLVWLRLDHNHRHGVDAGQGASLAAADDGGPEVIALADDGGEPSGRPVSETIGSHRVTAPRPQVDLVRIAVAAALKAAAAIPESPSRSPGVRRRRKAAAARSAQTSARARHGFRSGFRHG